MIIKAIRGTGAIQGALCHSKGPSSCGTVSPYRAIYSRYRLQQTGACLVHAPVMQANGTGKALTVKLEGGRKVMTPAVRIRGGRETGYGVGEAMQEPEGSTGKEEVPTQVEQWSADQPPERGHWVWSDIWQLWRMPVHRGERMLPERGQG